MTAHHRHAPADPTRINLEHDDEVRYWCIEFRITPDALRSAVDKVGPVTDDVRAELGLLSERG
jgi:hypothetical protein